ncbi:MAG: hypothetical protein A3F72_08140 [Bacteroidetes bacterium RIFCSPLOWO2_12_FULL_35_15]|nr:MAG: hypothetical protein A3F72_08140 [Bacteroidetes bacterium RIFCSPLOWO2_12_FULL_35_15]
MAKNKKKQCDSLICFKSSAFQFTFLDWSRINLCLQHYEELKRHMKKAKMRNNSDYNFNPISNEKKQICKDY